MNLLLRLFGIVILAASMSACASVATRAPSRSPGASVALAPASSSATPTSSPTPTASLDRPLHLPVMAPGARCPHSRARVLSPAFGPALGPGPVNPVGVGVDGVVSTDGQGGAWIHNVTWIAAPAYAGPARIRGHQLNGDGTISFGTDVVANASELALTPANALRASRAPGWRQWRSVLAVTKPGCYGLQIDGAGFSTVVIFDVR